MLVNNQDSSTFPSHSPNRDQSIEVLKREAIQRKNAQVQAGYALEDRDEFTFKFVESELCEPLNESQEGLGKAEEEEENAQNTEDTILSLGQFEDFVYEAVISLEIESFIDSSTLLSNEPRHIPFFDSSKHSIKNFYLSILYLYRQKNNLTVDDLVFFIRDLSLDHQDIVKVIEFIHKYDLYMYTYTAFLDSSISRAIDINKKLIEVIANIHDKITQVHEHVYLCDQESATVLSAIDEAHDWGEAFFSPHQSVSADDVEEGLIQPIDLNDYYLQGFPSQSDEIINLLSEETCVEDLAFLQKEEKNDDQIIVGENIRLLDSGIVVLSELVYIHHLDVHNYEEILRLLSLDQNKYSYVWIKEASLCKSKEENSYLHFFSESLRSVNGDLYLYCQKIMPSQIASELNSGISVDFFKDEVPEAHIQVLKKLLLKHFSMFSGVPDLISLLKNLEQETVYFNGEIEGSTVLLREAVSFQDEITRDYNELKEKFRFFCDPQNTQAVEELAENRRKVMRAYFS